MKIEKYIKDKQNKYKVIIDSNEYILYDDVIIKYNLLMKKEIDESTFKELLELNEELKSYYDSIKYINKKLRSKKEIEEYLMKKGINPNVINKTVDRLIKTNYLNDDIYFKAYINDQINLSNNGPKKILKNLINLGFDEIKIKEKIDEIDESIWNDKIDKYIEKKVKTNHNSSRNVLRMKIVTDLVNLGYDKEIINEHVSNITINEEDILKKEYEKAKRTLEKNYSGAELERKIKEKLYRKGFKLSGLEGSTYEE